MKTRIKFMTKGQILAINKSLKNQFDTSKKTMTAAELKNYKFLTAELWYNV